MHLSIIAKPTHDCNLSCKYCYIDEKVELGMMSEQVLAQTIEKVSKFAEDSHWIWHGGEPLLMGVEFFKIINDIQNFYKKREKLFSNSIQTNGILIDNELIELIGKTGDFHIGFSIDGPEEIHNTLRTYENGKGSFKDVMSGFELLKNNKKKGGAICVVNAKSINYPKKLYDFFKLEKINVKFNPLINSGRARENLESLWITPKQYGRFLSELWQIYNEDVQKDGMVSIDIDPFMDVIGNIETGRPIGCNYSVSCRETFISI